MTFIGIDESFSLFFFFFLSTNLFLSFSSTERRKKENRKDNEKFTLKKVEYQELHMFAKTKVVVVVHCAY